MAEGADSGTRITTAEANEIVANMRAMIAVSEPQTSPRYSEAELRRVEAMRHAEFLNPKTFADWRDLTLKVEAFIREADQSSDATGQAADYGKVAELFCREEAQETADA